MRVPLPQVREGRVLADWVTASLREAILHGYFEPGEKLDQDHIEDQELIDAFNKKYPGRKLRITEKRLETISEVCRKVHGEEFAKRCVDRIKENGYINRVQWYFGLEYRANSQAHGNDAYLKFMEELGFNWFKKYPPFDDKAT